MNSTTQPLGQSPLTGKTILLLGGTGSFGQEFTRVALAEHNPRAIRIYSRGEYLQSRMALAFRDSRLRFFIGDVRDRDRLYRAADQTDIIILAAALKQVPTCEYNPLEAVKTNVGGTANVVDVALDQGVERVIGLSSDKAVAPLNLYGATKAVMEKLLVQANVYAGATHTRFSCTRYGNVAFSRGSVVPLFLEQKEQGLALTITHPDMTRFWLSLTQAVRFVISSLSLMQGGEIFIPKLPSFLVKTLAEAIAPKAEKQIVGIRPGEKLDEVLLVSEEARHSADFGDYYVVYPEHPYWTELVVERGKPLPSGFTYSSCNPDNQWLGVQELRKLIGERRDD